MLKNSVNSVITHFGFNPEEFKSIMRDVGGYISGGSCLNGYLGRQIEKEQDLDIWIPSVEGTLKEKYVFMYLKSNGYVLNSRKDDVSYLHSQYISTPYYSTANFKNGSKFIRKIYNFMNTVLKNKVQIIITTNVDARTNISTFDMNICQFYADFKTSQSNTTQQMVKERMLYYTKDDINSFKTLVSNDELIEIHQGIGRCLYDNASQQCKNRVEKYTKRGFKLIPYAEKDVIRLLKDRVVYYDTKLADGLSPSYTYFS